MQVHEYTAQISPLDVRPFTQQAALPVSSVHRLLLELADEDAVPQARLASSARRLTRWAGNRSWI